ncbi:nucleobase:cation symporter-2 family protein [Amycolatopsis sp. NPDC050768]|uniref:nucleobase:cation symporter-2 family protein n=1 Tax=Amycolatopsis sp. NPDC050768 TaxID=3154839 RepID=UPI0033DDBFCF
MSSTENGVRHPTDQVPPTGRLLLLGLQHLFIMYTGCIAVPLIFGAAAGLSHDTIALLVDADLLVSGVITLIQSAGVGRILGVRLPIVAGATFTLITPMILITKGYGLQAVYGSMLLAGIFGLVIAPLFARVVRYFPAIVSGTVITVIGLSLIGVGVQLVAGSDSTAPGYASVPRLALAAGVILVIVAFMRLFKGILGQAAVLIGLVLGTAVAVPLGFVNLAGVAGAPWFGFPMPFQFGAPHFPIAAVLSMCVVMLVTFTESTADMLAVSEMVGKPLTRGDLARGLAADGLSGVLAGIMNSFIDTAYAENVGLVEITRIRSRWITAATGAMLIVLGCVPKLGAVVASLPDPVVGAAGLVMFAMVSAVGIRVLKKVDYADNHNLLVVALSIAVGMVPVVAPSIYTHLPQGLQIVFGSAITSTALCAFVLNVLFNHTRGSRKRAPAAGVEQASRAA